MINNKFIKNYLRIGKYVGISLSILPTISGYANSRTVHERANNKPNVILILADDMGIGDISKFNHGLTKTPNLDKLVVESLYFNNAYSAAPVCAPARASLLTGQYPHRTGCVTLNMERFPELSRIKSGIPTMADYFRNEGYVTGLIGKWHCGMGEDYHPLKRGFDEFEGFIDPFLIKSYFEYTLNINGKNHQFNDKYLTDDLTDRALGFIKRNKDKPFFLHLAHYAPHRPLSAPDLLIDYYQKKGYNKNTATIYAMIEIMDNGIGKLLDELEKMKLRKNTIIVFVSDNGPDPITGERFNQDLKGTKYTVLEGGIRVPFIFNWSGQIKPGLSNELIHFTDVLPTLADICGLTIPESATLDGGSFYGILFNEDYQLPEIRIWQWNRGVPYYTHNAAIRKGDWKLVRPFINTDIPEEESSLKPQLFNIADDPQEKNNLIDKNREEYLTLKVLLEQKSRELEYDRLKK
ncbi:MAG TPA: sulfatase-like hydrolase/transferase [Petrimonas sp.]|nr:sulfatase-like hydrolase/transferase [Petrimonas sp.]